MREEQLKDKGRNKVTDLPKKRYSRGKGSDRYDYRYDRMGNKTAIEKQRRGLLEETYTYDRRGNLSLIMENGTMKNSYTYGALNRLEHAVNGKGEAAAYEYNGL